MTWLVQVPRAQVVEKTVGIPQSQIVEKTAEVPQLQIGTQTSESLGGAPVRAAKARHRHGKARRP